MDSHNDISDKGFGHPKLRLPSKFNPPRPNNLDFVYNLLIERILAYNPVKGPRKLTNKQFDAMKQLADHKDIIIKTADKVFQCSDSKQG